MKKNSLNTAVLASLAGIAGIANISTAVNLNGDGTGQVLIYPYYTVNAGNQTILSVVNTTNVGKAVKVRFLEGRNSQEVLDFNLFLSHEDVWTAAILATSATSGGNIITFDTSCTLPKFVGQTIPFRSSQYQNDTVVALRGIDRTREGHFEMIEMGTTILGTSFDDDITHLNDDIPSDCPNALVAARNPALMTSTFLRAPTGGLFGNAAVLNVANGTYSNYTATALDNFWGPVTTAQYSASFDVQPSLASVESNSLVFLNGRVISSNWGPSLLGSQTVSGRIDAISALFMSDTLLNEYTTETGFNAASEWVITFPTKRFYVNNTGSALAFPPFSNAYVSGQACESLRFNSWNREERPDSCLINCDDDFSPPVQGAPPSALCFETNVLTFNQAGSVIGANGTSTPSKVLGSILARNITTPAISPASAAGWTEIEMTNDINPATTRPIRRTRPSIGAGHQYTGLPALGFWLVSIENNNATPGVKGFYGGAYDHKHGRRCENLTVAPFGACVNP